MKKRFTIICLLSALAVLAILFTASSALAATGASIDRVTYSGGTTEIAWSVTGSDTGKYKVFVQVVNEDSNVKQVLVYVGETSSHSIRTTECIPGLKYEITISDSDYNILAREKWTMPSPDVFQDGKLKATSVKVSIEARKLNTGDMISKDTKKVNTLKASDIISGIENNTASYGVKYTMKMPQLSKARSFFVTIAFESPSGFIYVEHAGDMEFARVNRGYQTIWFYMIGSNFFREMYNTTGEIPTGKYSIFLLWDGMYVNQISFNVR